MTLEQAPERPQAARRAQELRPLIAEHQRRYYGQDTPQIDDSEFDALFRELQMIEQRFPDLVTEDSPTLRPGGAPDETFRTIEHPKPMLSLGNVFSADELRAWYVRAQKQLLGDSAPALICEPKIDGLAFSLIYQDGRLASGATRGDGVRGEDITANLRTLASLPQRLNSAEPPAHVEVRGEVYLPLAEFERLNKERASAGEAAYRNPRNTAAGALRQADPAVTAERGLAAFAYQVDVGGAEPPASQTAALAWLKDVGLPVNPLAHRVTGVEEAIACCEEWARLRPELSYEIDGVVVKIDDSRAQRQLGATGHEPRWATAWKFAAEEATTDLLDIQVSVGRTGALTPFAVLKPVLVGGALVSLATLHNEEQVAAKGLLIGDRVIVRRAGDVIPEVVGPVISERGKREASLRPFTPPQRCPSCESESWLDGSVRRCPNRECPARVARLVEHFASRDGMDIEGLGEKRAEQLTAAGLVRDVSDIYRLHERQAELQALEGMGQKSGDKLLRHIDASREQPLERLLIGFGVHHAGRRVSRLVAAHFGSMEPLLAAQLPAIEAVDGVGPVAAAALHNWLADAGNAGVVRRLAARGVRMDTAPASAVAPGGEAAAVLAGTTVVVTGTLERWGRKEASALIARLGGTASSSVSGKTTFLVAGEKAGSKLTKAMKLGVRVLNEAEFVAELQQRGWDDVA